MADDASTEDEADHIRDGALPGPAIAPLCAECDVEPVACAMEFVNDPCPDHGDVFFLDLCGCCTAAKLLTMPHGASLVQHPFALRPWDTPVERPAALEHHGEPESFRPLKKRRPSELQADHMCQFCNRCQLAVSLDLIAVPDGSRMTGEYCYRCGAKFLIEVTAGKFKFNELNPTAILFIC